MDNLKNKNKVNLLEFNKYTMTKKELNKELIDILDNVMSMWAKQLLRPWETCPEDYKVRVEAIIKQLILIDVSDNDKCSICKINEAQSKHTCPYAEDINDDSDSLCNCCSNCKHECCMDI